MIHIFLYYTALVTARPLLLLGDTTCSPSTMFMDLIMWIQLKIVPKYATQSMPNLSQSFIFQIPTVTIIYIEVMDHVKMGNLLKRFGKCAKMMVPDAWVSCGTLAKVPRQIETNRQSQGGPKLDYQE
jgi:hypothetical protein